MTDQMRAIDNKRLTKKTGLLPQDLSELVKQKRQDCIGYRLKIYLNFV